MTKNSTYKGRFAPTPSGKLHFGSLVTAVASYLDARSKSGYWSIRMDDLDRDRVVNGSSDSILKTLEKYGFQWDGEVIYQSRNHQEYAYYINLMKANGYIYPCKCSRKAIQSRCKKSNIGAIYDRHCKPLVFADEKGTSLRVSTFGDINFTDVIMGNHSVNLTTQTGDFIVKRSDGVYSYNLATVVDDHNLGVTDIVRGGDLHNVTFSQIYLYQILNLDIPTYAHVPLVLDKQGLKLSKSSKAQCIESLEPTKILLQALTFLGQNIPKDIESESLSTIWSWAICNWDLKN
ncbi:putative glutamyl-queuosine tRNA(Asp) synthetase [Vibrio nigripulchritudo SFn27]|uniref:Putative glutamyl-queuosine tRNA(Asp) synthetase n=1 Tax=Vibrio nigripulchritudo TaxID=28173 RepID=U4K9K0_9VIBR|nr:tRNA glutamyl-Q(34) synthetase GluQRS [Vibrio nigripulchritudo]CCN85661.1 putative glutamyl-queuosine tRNA(Asp) synthetase [Vibrio nigripulchritudo BLFn1]CCN91073.1 putative glutamyl-queuosine tRNA(Asp) synthetase [Vibrio nigripulchritudo SFn27]CCN93553.1 putative glutamyl-queuosine tRNA(Asp) synthetase [Vibrio nigripulchritudo ENn2]CCO40080.1 putative glutamyl-queuosine tRNA(Asp) synthetase [Vibrio nigripulchritudo SFn135]CCO54152.1 putative glutamyl-queuosine tRNA(Asp) synthetase [Vibrio 